MRKERRMRGYLIEIVKIMEFLVMVDKFDISPQTGNLLSRQIFLFIVSKVGDFSQGRPEGSLFSISPQIGNLLSRQISKTK